MKRIANIKRYLIWGSAGAFLFVLEYLLFYHFVMISSNSFGLTLAISIFGWLYSREILFDKKRLFAIRLGNSEKLSNYKIHEDLIEKYNNLTKGDFKIYLFSSFGKTRKPPSFTSSESEQGIHLHEGLASILEDKEQEALILHEIYHLVHRDVHKKYFLTQCFAIFLGILSLSVLDIILYGIRFLNIVLVLVSLSGALLSLLLIKIHAWYSERAAGFFSGKQMNTNSYIISVLLKVCEFKLENCWVKNEASLRVKCQKRIDALERKVPSIDTQ